MRRVTKFAPPLVVTIAACSSGVRAPKRDEPRELTWIENRGGVCTQQQDCSPVESGGVMVNPCNPPPPTPEVECPRELLATQPPGTTVEVNDDGTCWVTCDDLTCSEPGAMRVACPDPTVENAMPPSYERALVVPAQAQLDTESGPITRHSDLTCVYNGAAIPCPPELIPRTADGVVPVSTIQGCFYGTVAVACPDKRRVWR